MKVARNALIRHINKIECGGQIEGGVFTGAFETRALSQDQILFLTAPPLPGAEELPQEVGLTYLDTFRSALKLLEEEPDPEDEVPEIQKVELGFEGSHLVINEGSRGLIRILLSAPRTIWSHIDDEETLNLIQSKLPGPGALKTTLTARLLSDIQQTFKVFKADEIELTFGPDGGQIRVGNKDSNTATFPAPELKDGEERTMLFGSHLVDVLSVVDEDPLLRIGDPGTPILIQDGDYKYQIAATARGADE